MSVIITGDRILLRDFLPSDLDTVLGWHRGGEWREFDAPWHQVEYPAAQEEQEEFAERFLTWCEVPEESARRRAAIAMKEGKLLGWVVCYGYKRHPAACRIGIDICEDVHLNKGLGTEALGLWVDYLFTHSDFHKIGIDTWFFNVRMRRVAENLGFVFEGAERELREWQGEWLDLLHFGLLREEWAKRKK